MHSGFPTKEAQCVLPTACPKELRWHAPTPMHDRYDRQQYFVCFFAA